MENSSVSVERVALTEGETRLLQKCELEMNRLKVSMADLIREYEKRKERFLVEIDKAEQKTQSHLAVIAQAHGVEDSRVMTDLAHSALIVTRPAVAVSASVPAVAPAPDASS